jgi:hypothetical protein
MCHPVAITGSTYLHTQRTITVPTAMDCAARSIHHSPLSQSPPPPSMPLVTAAAAPAKSPATIASSAAPGNSSISRPTTPSPKPATPAGASVSP